MAALDPGMLASEMDEGGRGREGMMKGVTRGSAPLLNR